MSLVVDIKKKFAGFTLEMSFSAEDGRLGLLGESGSGKSMTLKCVAGIERPDEGRIVIDGETVFDSATGIDVPARLRFCGYLFQNYALFPHLTVVENIALALRAGSKLDGSRRAGGGTPAGGPDRVSARKRVADLVAKFALEGLEHRKPARISGGQQQRLALARMLAACPRLICLDEPFSALDSTIKTQVEEELDDHLSDFPGTILFVSHNRDEAYRFCDNLVIVDRGSVAEADTLEHIFSAPRSVAAARLTGCKNIAKAFRTGDRSIFVPDWNLDLETYLPVPPGLTHAGIHAHHVARGAADGDAANTFDFTLARVSPAPFSETEHLQPLPGGRIGLLREVPSDISNVTKAPTRSDVARIDVETHPAEIERHLYLPPEKILLLRG